LDWFSQLVSSSAGAELRRMIADAEPVALAGVIVTEILQGLKRDVSRLEHYLSQWEMLEPKGFSTYREAASIFRAAGSKGVAVTATDVLIAAIALEHGTTLFTMDKDFTRIASIIRLPLYVYWRYAPAKPLMRSLNSNNLRIRQAKKPDVAKRFDVQLSRWFRV
jgi:predicted nucleic acid-binding protein